MPVCKEIMVICFWKIINNAMGGIIENTIPRKISTSLALPPLNWNSLTITVSKSDPLNVKYGRRKSDHAAFIE
jgi:hypothetical protein